MKASKKAALDNLADLLTGLGVIAILAAVIFLVIGEAKTQVIEQDACNISTYWYNSSDGVCCQNSTDCSVTTGLSESLSAQIETQSATSDIPGWLPIIVITIIGGALLMLVRMFKQK